MKQQTLAAATCAAAVIMLALAAGGSATEGLRGLVSSTPWMTIQPTRVPMSLQLPKSWQVEKALELSGNLAFAAGDQKQAVGVTINGTPYVGSQSGFASRLYGRVREVDLIGASKAVFHSQIVALPAGRAVRITATWLSRIGQSYQQVYGFLKAGRQYEVEYLAVGGAVKKARYAAIFTKSAASIRFISGKLHEAMPIPAAACHA